MFLLRSVLIALFLLPGMAQWSPAANDAVFGPTRYAVTERYGRPNEYSFTVPASDKVYLIKLENGDANSSRSDYLALTVNGRAVVRDGAYPYPAIACFVQLGEENSFRLSLRDELPSGFRRPVAAPKSVTVTVLPVPREMETLRGSFGLAKWSDLKDLARAFQGFKEPAAAGYAMDAYALQLTSEERVAAVKGLSAIKDERAEVFLVGLFTSLAAPSDVRAEAALAAAGQGNPELIPMLVRGLIDPDERIRTASARGLSLYPEEQTGDRLLNLLRRLDKFRRQPAIDSIGRSGWKPLTTMKKMADDPDPVVSAAALELIGKFKDPRSTEYLLQMLQKPDRHDPRAVISALGQTMDPQANQALLAMAADPRQRQGREVALADALANLGDRRAAPLIGDMIRNTYLFSIQERLQGAYQRLTGERF